jgi:hypothetical protein
MFFTIAASLALAFAPSALSDRLRFRRDHHHRIRASSPDAPYAAEYGHPPLNTAAMPEVVIPPKPLQAQRTRNWGLLVGTRSTQRVNSGGKAKHPAAKRIVITGTPPCSPAATPPRTPPP